MHLLFFSRLALYMVAFLIPAFHPAVAVAYDWLNRVTFFVLLPASMFAAHYARPPRFRRLHGLGLMGVLYAGTVLFVTGPDWSALIPLVVMVLTYVWTFLVFNGQGRFPAFAAFEMFGLAVIYYRILEYSRASEDIAERSGHLSSFLIAFVIILFLVHGLVLYFSAFPKSTSGRNRLELGLFLGLGLPVALLFGFLIPPSFVQNKIVINDMEKEPPLRGLDGEGNLLDRGGSGHGRSGEQGEGPERHNRNGKPLGNRDEKFPSELQGQGEPGSGKGEGEQPGKGNRRGDRDGQGKPGQGKPGPGQPGQGRPGQGKPGQGQPGQGDPRDGQGGDGKEQQPKQEKNKLEGVPSDQWNNFKNSSGAGGKQMAVMVIASKIQPVYAAESYEGSLDPSKGFQPTPDEPLNALRSLHLLETWRDSEPERNPKREPFDIYYLSTIRERVLAYRPYAIQPTILDKQYHPFDLSYRASSAISVSTPEDWATIREPHFGPEMDRYLSVPFDEAKKARYRAFLNERLKGQNGYFNRLNAILKGFSTHRYKMGFDEDASMAAMDKFLFETKEGDCTEFSEAAAVLGRMAGIPSRVVTGYLASRDLQTPAHRGGIKHLRNKIPALQKFPLDELYLVTTSQRHAWVQFFMPGYGWVDFESTAYAIPPTPEFDPNAMDVVIPLIDEEALPPEAKSFRFPWKFFGIVVGILGGVVVVGLYGYRFGRLGFHAIGARSGNRKRAVDSQVALFYIALAEQGHPIRQFFETPLDFARRMPETEPFALRATELRYRERWSEEEGMSAMKQLADLRKETLHRVQRTGSLAILRRIFTLRGLLYRP